jgi:aspartate aminotransferase/aminotransferase
MTGWRLGFAHGPRRLIEEMIKLQQFTYVCAPSMVQHAGVAAWDCDISSIVADYKKKRDRLVAALKGAYELVTPGGAFYLFPKVPSGTDRDFVAEGVRNNLLVIPGHVFSKRDSHFRISYAASDEILERGIGILLRMATKSAVR